VGGSFSHVAKGNSLDLNQDFTAAGFRGRGPCPGWNLLGIALLWINQHGPSSGPQFV